MYKIGQSLRLAPFAPVPAAGETAPRRSLVTAPTWLTPDELPVQGLAYCAYNILVLTADAFAAAHERQLQALRQWVRAGGSVCVFATGALREEQAQFLTDLNEGRKKFELDDKGQAAGPGVITSYCGLGRAVVVTKVLNEDTDLNSAEWRGAVAFLWKLRRDRCAQFVRDGKFENPVAAPSAPQTAQAYAYNMAAPLQTQPLQFGAEVVQHLMPKTVRLIPFSVLLCVLTAFVLLIGPVDWLVLGFLKRRRYTWILFGPAGPAARPHHCGPRPRRFCFAPGPVPIGLRRPRPASVH